MIEIEKRHPSEDGCWFCDVADGDMLFSYEFDTFVHRKCLIEEWEDELKNSAEFTPNREVEIMAKELLDC